MPPARAILGLACCPRVERRVYQLQPADAMSTNDAAISTDAMMAATILLIGFSLRRTWA